MRELSLHLLDIAENSIAAAAKTIEIIVAENTVTDRLFMQVKDDGKGMDAKMVERVIDPFTTTRTTRKVGLGIPLLKAAAEACNGYLTLKSEPGVGTILSVEFQRSHIDRMPLGDLAGTILGLIVGNPQVHWVFQYRVNEGSFTLDDAPIKHELEDVPLSDPLVLSFLKDMIGSGIQNLQTEPSF